MILATNKTTALQDQLEEEDDDTCNKQDNNITRPTRRR